MAERSKKKAADEALQELKQDLQRVQADFVNFKRRIESERSELLDLARAEVVAEFLPLFDNLDRALGHVPVELRDNAWAQGVEQVARQVTEALTKQGISLYGQTGDEFDPSLHEAIAHEGPGNQIVAVLQRGYRLGDRIIRPAMVKVGANNHETKKEN